MLRRLASSTVFLDRRGSFYTKKLVGQFARTKTVQNVFPMLSTHHYSSLSKEDEEKEFERVKLLSESQKEKELKELDKEIARLYSLRGINTGDLHTFRGRFKALARDYGIAFMAWYWVVWTSTAALTYAAIEVGGIEAIELIARVDNLTGFEFSQKVDPAVGTIGLTLIINEMLEPLRLPIVVFTTKPIVDTLSSKK